MLMILVKITTFSTFLFPVRSSTDSGDINWWCNKTPYPEPCKYYLSREGGGGGKARRIQRYEFRDLAVNAAVEAAVVALNHVELLRLKCREEREKAAWTDCLKLHETTVFQLEKTLDTTAKHSQFDLQTWLSSALTNLDTCRNGFVELGFSDKIVPVAVISGHVHFS
ncbi:pectinesterase [Sarracenia purpurea var. burkii]